MTEKLKQYNHRKGILFVLLSTIMYGSYGVWSRLIGDSFGVFYQGYARALLIALVLLPILLYKKELVAIKKRDLGWLSIFLLFTSLTQAPIFYAFNHMDIGTASVLFFVSTLITMYVFGFIFLKEKVTTIKTVSFILACIGLFLTFSFTLAIFPLFAALMAILNGIASGGEISSSKKLSDKYSPLYLVWMSWVVIAITNCIVSLILKEQQYLPSLTPEWFLLIVYAFAGLFGFWLVIAGLKYAEASISGLMGLLEIIFSILFGVILFHEIMTTKIIIGAVIIILAASFPHLYELRKILRR